MEGKRQSLVCNMLSSQAGWHVLFLGARVRENIVLQRSLLNENGEKKKNYYHMIKIKRRKTFQDIRLKI